MRRVLHLMALVPLIGASLFLAFGWPHIPDRIATHYGFDGQANAWGSKDTLIFLLGVAWASYLSLTLLPRIAPGLINIPGGVLSGASEPARQRVMDRSKILLAAANLLASSAFGWIIVRSALPQGPPLGAWFTPVVGGAAILLGLLGTLWVRRGA